MRTLTSLLPVFPLNSPRVRAGHREFHELWDEADGMRKVPDTYAEQDTQSDTQKNARKRKRDAAGSSEEEEEEKKGGEVEEEKEGEEKEEKKREDELLCKRVRSSRWPGLTNTRLLDTARSQNWSFSSKC